MAEQEAIGLLEQLARDFNVRDPRKLFQIARREFPDRPDECAGRGGPARRRGPAGAGAQAEEPGEERGGGAQRPAAGGPGGLQPEHERAEQVRLGGPRRLHPGDSGGNGDAGGRGDHPGPGPGGGQLRRYHGSGQRVPGPRGGAARRGGAPAKGPHGPQCNGGRR